MNQYVFLAGIGALAMIINLTVTPIILWLSHRYGWYDENDARKIHTEDTPRLGGLGIVLSFVAASLVGTLFGPHLPGALPNALLTSMPVYIGLSIVFIIGVVDDFRNLPALYKLIAQIVAATVVTVGPFRINELAIPAVGSLNFGFFAYPVTIVWIVGLMNAVNFIDGMDGLAGGTALVAALFSAIIGSAIGLSLVAVFGIALVGSLLGFLVFNFPPARIFMGDSGSTSIGFLLAVLPLFGVDMDGPQIGLIPTVTLLLIPVLDTASAIIRRQRKGVPIYKPDREHLHHKLLDLQFTTRRILALVYSGGIVAGLGALAWVLLPGSFGVLFVGLIWCAGIAAFLFLHRVRVRHQDSGQRSG